MISVKQIIRMTVVLAVITRLYAPTSLEAAVASITPSGPAETAFFQSGSDENGERHFPHEQNKLAGIVTNLVLLWIGILGLVVILLMKIREADRIAELRYKRPEPDFGGDSNGG